MIDRFICRIIFENGFLSFYRTLTNLEHCLEEKLNCLPCYRLHTRLVEESGLNLFEMERRLWKSSEMTITILTIRYDHSFDDSMRNLFYLLASTIGWEEILGSTSFKI